MTANEFQALLGGMPPPRKPQPVPAPGPFLNRPNPFLPPPPPSYAKPEDAIAAQYAERKRMLEEFARRGWPVQKRP